MFVLAIDFLQFLGLAGHVFEVLQDHSARLAVDLVLGQVIFVLQRGGGAGVEVDGELGVYS